MKTGGYRRSLLRDIVKTATLTEHLKNISIYIIACQAHDIGPEHYRLNDFFHAMNHTTKHVMGGCSDLAGAREVWRLARTTFRSTPREV